MKDLESDPPIEEQHQSPFRTAGVLLAWGVYGSWVGLRWLFEGRRRLVWLAFLVIGGWYAWGHRYHIAEEWGRLRGRYQGAMELEREQARRDGEALKNLGKDPDAAR